MASFQGSFGRHWRLPYIRTPGCLARLKGCRHHAHALGMCSRQLLPVPTWPCYLHTPSPRHHLAFVRPFRRKRCDVTSFSCVCESNCICKTRQITVCHFRSQATRSAQHSIRTRENSLQFSANTFLAIAKHQRVACPLSSNTSNTFRA